MNTLLIACWYFHFRIVGSQYLNFVVALDKKPWTNSRESPLVSRPYTMAFEIIQWCDGVGALLNGVLTSALIETVNETNCSGVHLVRS